MVGHSHGLGVGFIAGCSSKEPHEQDVGLRCLSELRRAQTAVFSAVGLRLPGLLSRSLVLDAPSKGIAPRQT